MLAADMLSVSNRLSRTSSASSVSSVSSADTQPAEDIARDSDTPRRTRKRFTSTQLMALEHLYHQTSHPTREQREILSKEAGIELRSVTVWFQNKRQTERKIALHHTANDSVPSSDGATPFPTVGTTVVRPRRTSNASSVSPPLSASPSLSSISSTSAKTVRTHTIRPQLTSARRPSLDHIASRAERPSHMLRTPTRLRTQSSPNRPDRLYDNMPSSPTGPTSPIAERNREYVDFAMRKSKSKPTLEWACAAARMSGKRSFEDYDIEEMVLDACDDTEDEGDIHEAVTPSSSQGSDSKIWRNKRISKEPSDLLATPRAKLPSRLKEQTESQVAVSDEDVMDAALALCGLGGGFSLGKR